MLRDVLAIVIIALVPNFSQAVLPSGSITTAGDSDRTAFFPMSFILSLAVYSEYVLVPARKVTAFFRQLEMRPEEPLPLTSPARAERLDANQNRWTRRGGTEIERRVL